MSLEFTQKQIELEIAALLDSGDITKISQVSGIGYSYIDQQLNPNDERKSAIYCALKIVCAIDEIDASRGEAVWAKIVRFRELSKPKKANAENSLQTAAANVLKESAESVSAQMLDKPLLVKLAEALDVIEAAEQHKQAILDAINEQKENGASGLRAIK